MHEEVDPNNFMRIGVYLSYDRRIRELSWTIFELVFYHLDGIPYQYGRPIPLRGLSWGAVFARGGPVPSKGENRKR